MTPRARRLAPLSAIVIVTTIVSACAGAPEPARAVTPAAPTTELQPSAGAPSPAPQGAKPDAGASTGPLDASADPQSAPNPEPPPEPPSPKITIELPYKLGQRASTAAPGPDGEAERARWNRGGRGEAQDPPPPPEGHPLPRVIIDILRVKGPLPTREVQAIARRTMWIKVIGCYQLGAYKDQSLRGKTTVRIQASRSGKVTRSTMAGTSLPDASVAACLAREMKALELPGRKTGSAITATIQVHPGDDPMPPPESAVTPGEGSLAPQEIARVLGEATPRLLACYKESLAVTPGLWGRLAVRLHVTSAGKVDEAFETESTFPDPRAVQCILRAARSLDFPKPAGGDLRFVAPLRLSPR